MNKGDIKRSYSEAEKAGALAVLTGLGGNLKAASKRLGIPAATLANWRNGEHVNEDVTEKCAAKKESLADECERLAALILGTIDEETVYGAPLNYRTTAFGTLIDKMRLLREQPSPDAVVLAGKSKEQIEAEAAAILARLAQQKEPPG